MLKFINEQLTAIGVPYEFGEWASDIEYPYFVGEMPSPEEIEAEDGKEEAVLFLNGFNRGNLLELEYIKENIKKHFDPIHGLRANIEGGTIAVFYEGAFYPQTDEADLKRIQINLKIKKWKGA